MPLRGGLRRPPDAGSGIALPLQPPDPGVLRPLLGERPDVRPPERPCRGRCRRDGYAAGLRLERDAEPPDPPGPEAAPADRQGSGQAPRRDRPAPLRDGQDRQHPPGHPSGHGCPPHAGDDRHHPPGGLGEQETTSKSTLRASTRSEACSWISTPAPPSAPATSTTAGSARSAASSPHGSPACATTWGS